MRIAIIGFAIGIAWLQMRAQLPSAGLAYFLSVVAILLFATSWAIQHTLYRTVCRLICGIILGAAWAATFAHFYLAKELPKELEAQDIAIVGTIDSLPYYFEGGVRFNFRVESTPKDESLTAVLPHRLALSWYPSFAPGEKHQVTQVRPGQRWQLNVRLRRPHGNANPHGFDYEAWLLEQNLRATGYVRPDSNYQDKNQLLTPFVANLRTLIEHGRFLLRDKINSSLEGKSYAGVIAALVIGDQRGIAQSDWKIFNQSGIGHLISISGLHITMIASLIAAMVSGLWRQSFFTQAQLPLWLPAQKAAALAGAVAAVGYVALAGFGIPAQRTMYMLIVVAIALWTGRIANVSHVLCFALGAVLLLDPWAVLWPGFWLSFGAVSIILYVSAGRLKSYAMSANAPRQSWRVRITDAARMQLAITFGLIPLTILLFGQISLISPIANAIAIPLISLVVTPLALSGSVLPDPLATWFFTIGHTLIEWLAGILTFLTQLPWAVWESPVPVWWMFACALIGTIWLLAPRGWPVRWIGALAWLPVLLNVATRPPEGEMWITAFDLGQGGGVLIETANRRLLYDTGPAYSTDSDGGSRVIVPYLKKRGIDSLDMLIISHKDNDHSGGALSILDEIKIRHVLSSLALDSAIVRASPNHERCQTGQSWNWDGVQFQMLHPDSSGYENQKWKSNAISCTLKVSLGDQSLLLPGDIEAAQEALLVDESADQLRSTVLMAPHHGSGTSSTRPFLEAVQPEMALFQVGYRNRYRHPKQEVYDRYGELGIRRYRSDESGAILMRFKSDVQLTEYRKENVRYWHDR